MRKSGIDVKGWGHEYIWATNDLYCGKVLSFETGKQCSMHFHLKKHETWLVADGIFDVEWIETTTAELHSHRLIKGDTWINIPGMPHRLKCIQAGTIIEVSTPDSVEDNYRIAAGDSQQ